MNTNTETKKEIDEYKSESSDQLHVILGVNGNAGRYIAQELLNKGYKVRGISRSGKGPENVETIKADALNYEELKQALTGASVVYHCLGIPYSKWTNQHPLIMNNLIDAAYASKNGSPIKIVFADNLYAFGERGAKLGPMNENTPLLATDKKGLLRKQIESMLFEAGKEGKIIASVGKASDFFGPDATNSLFEHFVRPKIMNHKTTEIFGNLHALHSYIYVKDFARGLVTLGTSDKANGQVFVLPHFEAISIESFISKFYIQSGVNIPKKVKTSPFIFLKLAGLFSKEIREYEKMVYQMKNDWVIDDSKFRSTFPDYDITPLEKAFEETFTWYEENN